MADRAADGPDWLRDVIAEALAPGVPTGLVAVLNEMIAAEVPEIAADSELRRDLDASTTAHAHVVVAWLSENSTDVRPPPAAHALARTIARRGLPLRLLMRIYRAGHSAALRFVGHSLQSEPTAAALSADQLLELWERLSLWLNVSLELLTETYTEEREAWLRGAFARRTATVQAILRGDPVDPDEAAATLGHPLHHQHVGVVLWSDGDLDDGTSAGLEGAAARLIAEVGPARALTVPSGARGLWAWLSGDTPIGPDVIDRVGLAAGVHVAVGTPGRGLPGFRSSHREALAAQRIAERTGAVFTRFADVEIAHLLGADPEAAGALAARELAGILGPDATARRLRETLQAYLGTNSSPDATARELGVHKNTVRYRIQQIETIIGHPVESRRLHLELALVHLGAAAS